MTASVQERWYTGSDSLQPPESDQRHFTGPNIYGFITHRDDILPKWDPPVPQFSHNILLNYCYITSQAAQSWW